MKNSKTWMDDIERLYVEKTNISKKQFKKYRKHDLWWRFDKCKKLGIVDDVWNNVTIKKLKNSI